MLLCRRQCDSQCAKAKMKHPVRFKCRAKETKRVSDSSAVFRRKETLRFCPTPIGRLPLDWRYARGAEQG